MNWLITQKSPREQTVGLWSCKAGLRIWKPPHLPCSKTLYQNAPCRASAQGNNFRLLFWKDGHWPQEPKAASPLLGQTNDLWCALEGRFFPWRVAVISRALLVSSLTTSGSMVVGKPYLIGMFERKYWHVKCSPFLFPSFLVWRSWWAWSSFTPQPSSLGVGGLPRSSNAYECIKLPNFGIKNKEARCWYIIRCILQLFLFQ